MLPAAGKKTLREYINKRQELLAEWVALRPIFEVYTKELGYAGGGKLQETWCTQMRCRRRDVEIAAN